jgi:hypothetical protein
VGGLSACDGGSADRGFHGVGPRISESRRTCSRGPPSGGPHRGGEYLERDRELAVDVLWQAILSDPRRAATL